MPFNYIDTLSLDVRAVAQCHAHAMIIKTECPDINWLARKREASGPVFCCHSQITGPTKSNSAWVSPYATSSPLPNFEKLANTLAKTDGTRVAYFLSKKSFGRPKAKLYLPALTKSGVFLRTRWTSGQNVIDFAVTGRMNKMRTPPQGAGNIL